MDHCPGCRTGARQLRVSGLKKEKDVDRSQSITPQTGRKLDFTIIVLLVAALGFVVADNYVLDRSILDDAPSESQLVSIAVLPFVNMSADAEQEYFSDGFHLWSESYDRTLDDIFAVQDDIAEKIVRAVLEKDPLNDRHPRTLVRVLYYQLRWP